MSTFLRTLLSILQSANCGEFSIREVDMGFPFWKRLDIATSHRLSIGTKTLIEIARYNTVPAACKIDLSFGYKKFVGG